MGAADGAHDGQAEAVSVAVPGAHAAEELAGDYAAAAAALQAAEAPASWHDWPPNPWHLEPRCELLIAAGDLDGALRVADEQLPDREDTPVTARYMGACVRGKVSDWRDDPAAAVRHFELAARCADASDWADPGVRDRMDAALAEAYIAVGRPADAMPISAWLTALAAMGLVFMGAIVEPVYLVPALTVVLALGRQQPGPRVIGPGSSQECVEVWSHGRARSGLPEMRRAV